MTTYPADDHTPAVLDPIAEDSGARLITAGELLAATSPVDQSLFEADAPIVASVNDPNSVELGVRFTASADGSISGIRFFKGPDNDGPHVAHLWDANGNLLATATFANDSADGWQEVAFSTPVAIEAGATYVASYHTSGNYSATPNYFTSAQTDGHLSTQIAAGVYAYGSEPVFPNDSFNATNYLVDVVFNAPPVTITNLTLESGKGTLVDNHDGTWSYTPAPDDDGEVSFSYIASDGLHHISSTACLDIAGVNDAPVLTGPAATLVAGTEDVAYTIHASALLAGFTDVDGDTLSVADLTADHGTLTANSNGTWTFAPVANYNGPISLSYTVIDGHGGSTQAGQSFLLAAVNDAPVLTGPAATLVAGTEDVAYTIHAADLLAGYTDVDGGTLSVSGLTADHGTLIDNGNGTWSFAPAANYNGPVALNYTVIDGNGGSTPASQSFSLAAVNDPPVLSGPAATLAAGTEDVAYTIHAADLLAGYTDVDGGTLSVSGLTADHGTLIDNGNGTWSFAPAANYNGPVALNYTVIDGNGGSTPASQSFSLAAVNDPPVLSGPAATLAAGTEDVAYTIQASALLAGYTDVDGDTLSVSGLTADHGTLIDNGNGTWSFAPAANYNGPVALNYTVIDGNGGSTPASQSFSLAAVNDAPIAANDTAEVVEYATVTGTVLTAADQDIDGDALTVSGVSGASGLSAVGWAISGQFGTLKLQANGSYSYFANNAETLAAGQSGRDVFTYTVSDGNGTDTATLTVNVKGTNAGTNGDNLLQGTNADETFSGGGGNDRIDARGGSDLLDGGVGADNMRGGAGNDTYLVDNAGDVVNESVPGSTGIDTVKSSISFSLANSARVFGPVENLTLLGTGHINATGNALNNVLTGNAGNNVLNGGLGADNMRGLAGNDVYVVDNAGDIVNESLTGSNGIDTVQSSMSFSLANVTRVFGAVENLTLLGTGNISGWGNSLSNVLNGNAGSNLLDGAAGNDILNGGAGRDMLRGGAGNDTFVFNSALNASRNVDWITDFSAPADTIRLENSVFTALTATGVLASGAFYAGTAAHDANDRIIYNKATGVLTYDANGNAAGGAVQFATLNPGLTLTSGDFFVI